MQGIDITAIVNAHSEAMLAHATMLSLAQAVTYAKIKGISVEVLVVADNPTEETLTFFNECTLVPFRMVTVQHGDLGLSRNSGIQAAQGEWIAFLDADDLWGETWLAFAFDAANRDSRKVVWHPEVNLYFGMEPHVFLHADMDALDFDLPTLTVTNYWTSLSFSSREIYLANPYPSTHFHSQLGYEDWSWNTDTISRGMIHKFVPETTHFVRQRHSSLLRQTASRDSLMFPNDLFRDYIAKHSKVPKASSAPLQDPAAYEFYRQMLVLPFYRKEARLNPEMTEQLVLSHALSKGFGEGIAPTPLFDAEHYGKEVVRRRLPDLATEPTPFLHWMKHGLPRQIVPTPWFDEAYYSAANEDISGGWKWSFAHFIAHGVHEGRNPNAFSVAEEFFTQNPNYTALPNFYRLLMNMRETPEMFSSVLKAVQSNSAFIHSDDFREAFRRAAVHEPGIGDPGNYAPALCHPFFVHDHAHALAIQARLPKKRYENVLCVPHGRNGGADLVAGILSKTLENLCAEGDLLILQTDRSGFDRREWYSAKADVVDVSDIFGKMPAENAHKLLYSVILGVGPERLFCVQSFLCWNFFKRFGRRLLRNIELYAYMFCNDILPDGKKVGYPALYFADTLPLVTKFFIDSDSLRNELVETHHLTLDLQKRLVWMKTPTIYEFHEIPIAETQRVTAQVRGRPTILWAGRFDRQKRFDLLLEIAQRMPEVDFLCWGAPVLDSPPDLSTVPENLLIQGSFESLYELPLEYSDGWLYTSSWDGTPTILIHLGSLGVPVVASAVGGVPELIGPQTGWPIYDVDKPEGYIAAIREMIGNKDEAVRRASKLKELVAEQYVQPVFEAALANELGIAK